MPFACFCMRGDGPQSLSIGLFALMSYSVARRTNEIGIRMALGAEQRRVLGMVLRESMVLVAVGVMVGLAIALAAGRLVASQLFGVAATDPASMVIAIAVMVLVAGAAGRSSSLLTCPVR